MWRDNILLSLRVHVHIDLYNLFDWYVIALWWTRHLFNNTCLLYVIVFDFICLFILSFSPSHSPSFSPSHSPSPLRRFYLKQAFAPKTWYESLKENTFETNFLTLNPKEVKCTESLWHHCLLPYTCMYTHTNALCYFDWLVNDGYDEN